MLSSKTLSYYFPNHVLVLKVIAEVPSSCRVLHFVLSAREDLCCVGKDGAALLQR